MLSKSFFDVWPSHSYFLAEIGMSSSFLLKIFIRYRLPFPRAADAGLSSPRISSRQICKDGGTFQE